MKINEVKELFVKNKQNDVRVICFLVAASHTFGRAGRFRWSKSFLGEQVTFGGYQTSEFRLTAGRRPFRSRNSFANLLCRAMCTLVMILATILAYETLSTGDCLARHCLLDDLSLSLVVSEGVESSFILI